jgi:hypothetical protein
VSLLIIDHLGEMAPKRLTSAGEAVRRKVGLVVFRRGQDL